MPAVAFGAVARARGWLYDRRVLPIQAVPVPVVSIGNLSVGGTGKTPMVGYLVEHFAARKTRIGVLARGYGKPEGADLNEEGRMLAARFPDLWQVQDSDRVRGALELVQRGVQGILLDDGFQHRRLHRDRDIVLVDVTRPFGLPPSKPDRAPVRAPLPRGFLREGLAALRRADWIVLTRCEDPHADGVQGLLQQLRRVAPQAQIAITDHVPDRLWQARPKGADDPEGGAQGAGIQEDGTQEEAALVGAGLGGEELRDENLAAWRGREVDLVSGIGNPEAFARSVRALGVQVGEHRSFADHHEYTRGDLQGLGQRPVWTTAKDAPKILDLGSSEAPAPWLPWILEVRLGWHQGREALEADLDSLPYPDRDAERAALHAGLHG